MAVQRLAQSGLLQSPCLLWGDSQSLASPLTHLALLKLIALSYHGQSWSIKDTPVPEKQLRCALGEASPQHSRPKVEPSLLQASHSLEIVLSLGNLRLISLYLFLFIPGAGIEFRASHLRGRCPTTEQQFQLKIWGEGE